MVHTAPPSPPSPPPPPQGTPPPARCDSPLVYHETWQSLMVFGGWSSRWLGDFYMCDIHEVAGPPYTVLSITPAISPITGGTRMTITGLNYKAVGGDVKCRVASMRGFVDAPGTVIDDEHVAVETPDYVDLGEGEVELRLSIGSKNLTNVAVNFSYFPVASAATSLAFGPGLIEGAHSGDLVHFVIQAKDTSGIDRTCGMDEFGGEFSPSSPVARRLALNPASPPPPPLQ